MTKRERLALQKILERWMIEVEHGRAVRPEDLSDRVLESCAGQIEAFLRTGRTP